MTRRIAFMAISQAHQFLHWIPAALRLAAEPGVEVTVLGSSDAGLDFVRSFDPSHSLKLRKLKAPSLKRHGWFDAPARLPVLLLNARTVGAYDTIVTTETTSGLLRRGPGFRSRLVLIKHGAGDREGSYNAKHRLFDLILVNGEKHREALVSRGLAKTERIVVTGNAKLELVRPGESVRQDGRPLALYNPHFDRELSSWFSHGQDIVAAMEGIPGWDFIVAPHVKLTGGPDIRSAASNVRIDRGSARSIDMTYTQAANVYIGDVSSQVYEFILKPRPCIFFNLDRRAWRGDPSFAHWELGQVIESLDELKPALARAQDLQPQFQELQQAMTRFSIDQGSEPASERQARAILAFGGC